jgi:hypothetical protein
MIITSTPNHQAITRRAAVTTEAAGAEVLPQERSELSDLIGPEPAFPDASVWKSALKGVALGAVAGAATGAGARALYYSSGLSIPTAANIHFGALTLGGVGGGALLGQRIEPAFDPGTRAVLGGAAGLTFTLVTSMLGIAENVAASAVGGGIIGGVVGLTAGLLRSQEKSKTVFAQYV